MAQSSDDSQAGDSSQVPAQEVSLQPPSTAAQVREAYAKGVRQFPYWNLAGADLVGADLRDVNFYGANLHGANLSGADLSRANLAKANLGMANLCGANMSESYLDQTDLTGTDTTDMVTDRPSPSDQVSSASAPQAAPPSVLAHPPAYAAPPSQPLYTTPPSQPLTGHDVSAAGENSISSVIGSASPQQGFPPSTED